MADLRDLDILRAREVSWDSRHILLKDNFLFIWRIFWPKTEEQDLFYRITNMCSINSDCLENVNYHQLFIKTLSFVLD